MSKKNIKKYLEDNLHIFLLNVKKQADNTKEAADIIAKYTENGVISSEDEDILKIQLIDSLKIVGIIIPMVLLPGSSILMPLLLKVAEKNNIELMPTAFQKKKLKK